MQRTGSRKIQLCAVAVHDELGENYSFVTMNTETSIYMVSWLRHLMQPDTFLLYGVSEQKPSPFSQAGPDHPVRVQASQDIVA